MDFNGSVKVYEYKAEHEGKIYCHQYWIWCPGCKCVHAIAVGKHSFNDDFDKPTFQPSLLCDFSKSRCHSYITKGIIQFLGDCEHELKNQTVELPDFPEDQRRL